LRAPANCKFISLGNKSDYQGNRKVSFIDGEDMAKEIDTIGFFEVSAKDGSNIQDALVLIGTSILGYNLSKSDQPLSPSGLKISLALDYTSKSPIQSCCC
jgi:hypothetical protein